MGTLSVALATHNGARYVVAQLESLARQSRYPDELVVCDDLSTDDTVQLVEHFSRDSPFPVRIFRNDARLGYRKNFLKAAHLCRGDLIAFCDQDDLWHPEKLERLSKPFADPAVMLAFHNAAVVDRNCNPIAQTFRMMAPRTYAPLELPLWTIIPGFSQVIRRSLLDFSAVHARSVDTYCPTECMPHDQWFQFLGSVFGAIAYIPEQLASYRQHGANTSGWLPARRIAYTLHSVTHAGYYAKAAALAAENRLALLAELRELASDTSKIEAAVDHFDLARRYAGLRLKLYSSKSFRTRTRSIASLIGSRAYTRSVARFGLDNFLLDVCVGVPAGHVFRAP